MRIECDESINILAAVLIHGYTNQIYIDIQFEHFNLNLNDIALHELIFQLSVSKQLKLL